MADKVRCERCGKMINARPNGKPVLHKNKQSVLCLPDK